MPDPRLVGRQGASETTLVTRTKEGKAEGQFPGQRRVLQHLFPVDSQTLKLANENGLSTKQPEIACNFGHSPLLTGGCHCTRPRCRRQPPSRDNLWGQLAPMLVDFLRLSCLEAFIGRILHDPVTWGLMAGLESSASHVGPRSA